MSGRRSNWRSLAALGGAAAALAVLLIGASAWARVGGGESFSSGGSSFSGSGGDDELDLVFFLLWLCIEHPYIGIPVTIVVIVVGIMKKAGRKLQPEWNAGVPAAAAWTPPLQRGSRRDLERLRESDPGFSTVLFEDFLYALYASAHEARGQRRLETLAPYLAPPARARFHPGLPGAPGPVEVRDVVIGSMRVVKVLGLEPAAPAVRVTVRFETNFVEVFEEDGRRRERPMYAIEAWSLSRGRGVWSRPPERARKIGCPSCGAALTAVRGSSCSYCQQVVDTGAFDWRVDSIDVIKREPRPPPIGLGGGLEQGTQLPTLTAPEALTQLQALEAKDREFAFAGFRARAELIFRELQAAWSERDWMRVRPFVSDNLFQMQLYWIEGYRRQKARNVVDQVSIHQVELASVTSDAHYDAITVRLFASCLDYVEGDDGKLLRGSKSRRTHFSEYWTFIRGTGRRGPAIVEKKCPNCGAQLQINQAGSCEYCQAKVTSGDFDWVLSRIEQDEVYTG